MTKPPKKPKRVWCVTYADGTIHSNPFFRREDARMWGMIHGRRGYGFIAFDLVPVATRKKRSVRK